MQKLTEFQYNSKIFGRNKIKNCFINNCTKNIKYQNTWRAQLVKRLPSDHVMVSMAWD